MTLIELLVVLALVGIITSVALPYTAAWLDAIDVHGAANDAESMLATARHLAVARAERVRFEVDTVGQRLTIQAATDTLQQCDLRTRHGVTIGASQSLVTYSPLGMGVGASNATLTFSKGSAAETLRISRLGRVNR
jgi:prepilin-type N-terminal cleavage/methylation domain-containing protein